MSSVTSSSEIMLGQYCIGMQFNFRWRGGYGGCVIELLPVLAVNWNNGKSTEPGGNCLDDPLARPARARKGQRHKVAARRCIGPE
jgi:hypothetical protein